MVLRYQQNSEFGLYFELLVRKRNPCTRPIMLIPPFPLPPLLRNNCMKNRNTNRIVDSIDPLMVVVRIPSKRRKYLFFNFYSKLHFSNVNDFRNFVNETLFRNVAL